MRGALFQVHLLVDPAGDLGYPVQPVLQDALYAGLEGGGADGARTASALQLQLDTPTSTSTLDQHQVPTVLLDDGAHHLYEIGQLGEALGLFLIALSVCQPRFVCISKP